MSGLIDERTTLEEALAAYVADRDVELTSGTVEAYGWHLKRFSKFLGERARVSHLRRDMVDAFLLWLRDQGLSVSTRRGNRVALVVIWNWLFEEEHVDRPPRVRRLREPKPLPRAWTRDEVRRLIETAESLTGTIEVVDGSHIPRAAYWGSIIRTMFNTAMRLGDCLDSLKWTDIEPDGTVRVICHKTQRMVVRRLSPATVAVIRASGAEHREKIWPLPGGGMGVKQTGRSNWFRRFKRIVKASGIRPGTSKYLRRAAATAIAKEHGAQAASRFLDHRDVQTTWSNYLDQAQLGDTKFIAEI